MIGSINFRKKNRRIKLGNWVFTAPLLCCLILSIVFFKTNSHALDEYEIELVNEANAVLSEILESEDIMASVYLCDSYDVKTEPNNGAATVTTVYSGQLVFIKGVAMDDEFKVWSQVEIYHEEGTIVGYILREKLATSNMTFLDWECEYGMHPDYWNSNANSKVMTLSEGDDEVEIAVMAVENSYADIEFFPESYRPYLLELKKQHPNWTFVKVDTRLDFETVISKEMGDKSLISGGLSSSYREGLYGQNWYYATDDILRFYIDPRNSLSEDRIFQFEQLTFNEENHSLDALENFLKGTFMEAGNRVPEMDPSISYGYFIYAFCCEKAKRSLSPYHMASRIIQEQGKNGSVMISGTYPGYKGLYNYFNIGATGKTNVEIIENGLEYARKKGWDTGYKALEGGADFLYNSYIKLGQDTLYFQKFNVVPGLSPYTHQYMQNITAPTTESQSTMKMYKESDPSLSSPYVFKIPVYQNMPEQACPRPESNTKFYITLPEGYSSNGVSSTPEVWVDGVKVKSVSRNGYLVIDSGSTKAETATVYKYGSDGYESGMYVWFLDHDGKSYTATYQSDLEDLLSYWGFSIRVKEPSGIRFVSGIKESAKQKLVSLGTNGYILKEYGTLVTYSKKLDENGNERSFTKGESGVIEGISYGIVSGTLVDKSVGKTGDVTQFAAVFTNLPASVYKTDFNFRCYAVLSNNSKTKILYGPYYGRNIYQLAKKVISSGYYAVGSENYEFVQKLIKDADEYKE